MARLLIGGALLLVCGLLFVGRGITEGNWGEVGFGLPGFLIGLGALVFYKLDGDGRTPK